jgi:hypothetical protein
LKAPVAFATVQEVVSVSFVFDALVHKVLHTQLPLDRVYPVLQLVYTSVLVARQAHELLSPILVHVVVRVNVP